MKLSWKALLIAPLVMPVVYSAVLTLSAPGKDLLFSFLFFAAIGGVLSYVTVIFLFLPSLYLLSRFTQMTLARTGLLGTALSLLVYFPIIWQSYLASGVDSGPPQITFLEYLHQNAFDWDFWALLVAGLITSLLYWFLASQPPSQPAQPTG